MFSTYDTPSTIHAPIISSYEYIRRTNYVPKKTALAFSPGLPALTVYPRDKRPGFLSRPLSAGSGAIACSVHAIQPSIELGGTSDAETIVVVAVLRRVVVAVRHAAAVVGVVEPRAAAEHAERAFAGCPF